jgi:hypothetical protein
VNKFNNLRIPKTEYQENLKKIIKTNTWFMVGRFYFKK